MNEWRISEFSKLTGVSVRTLHHYDQIGLLKVFKRESNGFRLYSEKDLEILLKILSLKFLGFELLAIKELLDSTIPIQERFLAQKKLLDKKIDILAKASKILGELIDTPTELPADLILKLIDVYRVSHYLEKMHNRKLLPQEQIKKAKLLVQKAKNIIQQISTEPHELLIQLCSDFLREVHEHFPKAIHLEGDIVKPHKNGFAQNNSNLPLRLR